MRVKQLKKISNRSDGRAGLRKRRTGPVRITCRAILSPMHKWIRSVPLCWGPQSFATHAFATRALHFCSYYEGGCKTKLLRTRDTIKKFLGKRNQYIYLHIGFVQISFNKIIYKNLNATHPCGPKPSKHTFFGQLREFLSKSFAKRRESFLPILTQRSSFFWSIESIRCAHRFRSHPTTPGSGLP